MRPILRMRRRRLGELLDLRHTEQGSRDAETSLQCGFLRFACFFFSCLHRPPPPDPQRSCNSSRDHLPFLYIPSVWGTACQEEGPQNDLLFRATCILQNFEKSLLTLEGAPLWSMGRKDLERPRLATYFLWGETALWERLGSQKPWAS